MIYNHLVLGTTSRLNLRYFNTELHHNSLHISYTHYTHLILIINILVSKLIIVEDKFTQRNFVQRS